MNVYGYNQTFKNKFNFGIDWFGLFDFMAYQPL